MVSVDPVTATLPVAPASVHSGVGALAGAADGHPPEAAVGASGIEEDSASAIDDDVVDDAEDVEAVSELEPHAASVMPSATAQAASAAEEEPREKFTVATLQPPEPAATCCPRDRIRLAQRNCAQSCTYSEAGAGKHLGSCSAYLPNCREFGK